MTDMDRRPMVEAYTRMPLYFAPGVHYVTMEDGSIRRRDSRPVEVQDHEEHRTWGSRARRLWSYVRAEIGAAIRGPVSDEVHDERMAACEGCERRIATEMDPVGLCGACGCGASPRAMLTVKGRMPDATCPLGRWAPACGTGPTLAGLAAAIMGIGSQVAHVARQRHGELVAVDGTGKEQ